MNKIFSLSECLFINLITASQQPANDDFNKATILASSTISVCATISTGNTVDATVSNFKKLNFFS